MSNNNSLNLLADKLDGLLKQDIVTKAIYSTDASMYMEEPMAVVWPKNENDLFHILDFARSTGTGLILRGAGTSLAGQVVGSGLVVDTSRHMNEILEINTEERWVRIQPGVILEELNMKLASHGLFFGPETSTANRCTMGGMLGNNACGLHSLRYGSTREFTLEVDVILSDSSKVKFKDLTIAEFNEKCQTDNLEGRIYKKFNDLLTDSEIVSEIQKEYPDPSVPRRNTGYALDLVLLMEAFSGNKDNPLNLSKLIAGSEGTLAIITEIKLGLVPLPPPEKALCCVHLKKRNEAYRANLIALKYDPDAIEMMDDKILNLTKDNIEQNKNRFFLVDDPEAILIIEFSRDTEEEIKTLCRNMENEMKEAGYGYAFPVIWGKDTKKVWNLRKAGVGVLANMKGDAKPVSLLEDTAVNVNLLPDYMSDFDSMLEKHGKECIYHAHIGTGELHLRPVLNLKDPADVEMFHTLGKETAMLVKKYKGSLSGEHGDGRLRGEFIPLMLGDKIYGLLKEVKDTWDPMNIMNPGKIVDTPPMNSSLRFKPGQITPDPQTIFRYDNTDGYIRAIEKCNGSGDCRKTEIIGGTMCPSYMASKDEINTTRARANTLRIFLNAENRNPWDHKEIYQVLDLCLSCKGCKSECPSSVDMTKLKSEYMQHWYDKHGIPLRTRLIAYITSINKLGSLFPAIYNFFVSNKFFSSIAKASLGFARKRSLPTVYRITLRKWGRKNLKNLNPEKPIKTVLLFTDEFTNYNDTVIGIEAIRLLTKLGYRIEMPDHSLSGRTFLSKGLLRTAQKLAAQNVRQLSSLVSDEVQLIGLEPSAILGFRDEFPDLVPLEFREKALKLASNAKLIDEFISHEYEIGNIKSESFCTEEQSIMLHGHCQQKAVADTSSIIKMLSIPQNYKVSEIASGCCGMAGSFGYEKEHYDLSMKVGELVLFPAVREADDKAIISAPGTSCRHQIKDGTGKTASHPVQILYNALVV